MLSGCSFENDRSTLSSTNTQRYKCMLFTPAMKLAQLIQEKQRAAPQGRVLPPELAPGMASGELPAAQTPRKARRAVGGLP